MTISPSPHRIPSLRRLVLDRTGQDLRRCQGCAFCDDSSSEDQDIPLASLVQLILMNDEEVLTSRTVWADEVLQTAREACSRAIDLEAVLLFLRDEAIQRGFHAEDLN